MRMTKIKFNPRVTTCPMPICLVGAEVKRKPNFMAFAWFSKVNYDPPTMMVSLAKEHYTTEGIDENGSFSMNFPGRSLVADSQYSSRRMRDLMEDLVIPASPGRRLG
jgi:flavin reductase (DIM6/NTAB) family NADH-FMN oxidoreductase RutF